MTIFIQILYVDNKSEIIKIAKPKSLKKTIKLFINTIKIKSINLITFFAAVIKVSVKLFYKKFFII